MELNPEQLRVVERIMEHARETAPDPIVVIGPGGSGKTTSVMDAVMQLLKDDKKVLLCAPTHKAVEVLIETASAAGLASNPNLGFSTLHAALGLALLPTDERMSIAKMGEGSLHNYDYIVIDECSMLGKFVVETILSSEIYTFGHRVLFMGDAMQVFPVRESESPVFSLYEVQALKRVERFDGESGIADVTTKLRDAILSHRKFNYAVEDSESLRGLPAKPFKDEVCAVFADHDVNPLTDARVMAWRNSTVDAHNKRIRAARYGKHADPYVVGELLLAGRTIGDKKAPFAHVDQPLRVVACERNACYQWSKNPDDCFTVDKVVVETLDGKHQHMTNVVCAEGDLAFTVELTRLRRLAMSDRTYWPDYYRFLEAFDDLRYPYCTTVHKAQGSTYDRAYVDVGDIVSNNKLAEKLRLLYVACSRPRHQLILNTRNIRA